MVIGLDADFCICLLGVGVSFLGFCFFPRLLKSIMVVCGMLPWPAHLVCYGIFGKVGGRKVGGEGLCDLLGMGSERKGRPQHLSCYRGGDAIGGIGSQEQRERCQDVFSLLVALAGETRELEGVPVMLGLICNDQWRGCYLGWDSLWDPQKMGAYSWSSSAAQGMRVLDWSWRSKRQEKF